MSSRSPRDMRVDFEPLRGGKGGSELEAVRVDSSFCTGDLDLDRKLDRAAVPLARRSQLGLALGGGLSSDERGLSSDVTEDDEGGGDGTGLVTSA